MKSHMYVLSCTTRKKFCAEMVEKMQSLWEKANEWQGNEIKESSFPVRKKMCGLHWNFVTKSFIYYNVYVKNKNRCKQM